MRAEVEAITERDSVPEGGDGGGEIVLAGPPKEIVQVERSYTGRFLQPVLGRKVTVEPAGTGRRKKAAGQSR